jgi:hypothetical protein
MLRVLVHSKQKHLNIFTLKRINEEALLQDLLDCCVMIVVVVAIVDVTMVGMVVVSGFIGAKTTHFSSRERVTMKIAKRIRKAPMITIRWLCHHLRLSISLEISVSRD